MTNYGESARRSMRRESPLQGRLVLFAVLAALGGFALASLFRNSGAALGVAFLYIAVVETVRMTTPFGPTVLV